MDEMAIKAQSVLLIQVITERILGQLSDSRLCHKSLHILRRVQFLCTGCHTMLRLLLLHLLHLHLDLLLLLQVLQLLHLDLLL